MLEQLNPLAEIAKLPEDWHRVGSVNMDVLETISNYANAGGFSHTAETGSGKTPLLFSHFSQDHKVFALEGNSRSITVVRESPLFNADTVEWIEGPTQVTLPQHKFSYFLDVALIDGPHAYPFPEMEYFYFYPHLKNGGLLIIDDIHIATIDRLYEFLREDEMFDLLEVVACTAFFKRTDATLFDPYGDGWWLQKYNKRRFPYGDSGLVGRTKARVSKAIPEGMKKGIKRAIGRV